MKMNDSIEYKNICFEYDKKNVIFDNAYLKINRGNIYSLTGKNGTGKTTLFKILTGLYDCRCEINWFGTVVDKIKTIKNKIIMIPDNPYLYDYLTGKENLNLICKVFDIQDIDSVEKNIEKFQLTKEMDKFVKEYSLGMKSKLFLSICFAVQTNLMLFDEPFSSLDEQGQENAMRLLDEYINRGGIAIISTHISEYINKYLKNRIFIENKQIINKKSE